jgi:predicted transposase/invertase (TIGR01784 family)
MSYTSSFGRTFISFDWAMKRLLKQKANHVILEGFLSELLKQDVRVTEILDSESIAESVDNKTNRVDLLCKNDRGELIVIELQYFQEPDYFQRMLFGASKLVLEYLDKKLPYGEIKKIYSVHIVYFNLGRGNDYVYCGQMQFMGMHQNDILKLSPAQRRKFGGSLPADLYPDYYIINISKFEDQIKDTLDEWIYYFKHSELPQNHQARGLGEVEKQLKIDDMDPKLKDAYMEKLKDYGISEQTLMAYWDDGQAEGEQKGYLKGKEEGRGEGRAEGLKEGVRRGKAEGKAAGLKTGVRIQLERTVKRMHGCGMSTAQISEILELDSSEVNKIINDSGNASD